MISYSLEPKGEYVSLEGAQLPSDTPVYIRVENTGDIRSVNFILNNVDIRTEPAPFSFGGTGAFRRPRSVKLTNGPHILVALILRRDGFEHEEAVSFRVGNPSIPVTTPGPFPVDVTINFKMHPDGSITDISTEVREGS